MIRAPGEAGQGSLLIVQCSPRQGGVTDRLGRLFAQGARQAGALVSRVALRHFTVRPCLSCGACAQPPHFCPLSTGDGAEELFALMADSACVLFCSPIYFYALPGHFKCLIDRAQRFWQPPGRRASPLRPALACLAAGRPRGRRLFAGSLLTLRYFLLCQQRSLAQTRLWRGMEDGRNVDEATAREMLAWGRAWGAWLGARA